MVESQKVRRNRRRRGCPRRRVITFRSERIHDLPNEGSISEFAEVLGIHWHTLRKWLQEANKTREHIGDKVAYRVKVKKRHRWLVDKTKLVEWLIEEGHYKPRGDYESH